MSFRGTAGLSFDTASQSQGAATMTATIILLVAIATIVVLSRAQSKSRHSSGFDPMDRDQQRQLAELRGLSDYRMDPVIR